MKYLIRLDDACETMDFKKWNRIALFFDAYNIRPLVAVIPNNEDPTLKIDPINDSFWDWLMERERKGWEIGLHGDNHVYATDQGGINPIHKRSEFAGLSLDEQRIKIRQGFLKLKQKGFDPRIFIAPSHTFDRNTLTALKQESTIGIVSDTMSFFPYKKWGFIFIPQQLGAVRNVFFPGLYTFCYHPNTMNEQDFIALERFISCNSHKFIGFKDLKLEKVGSKNIFDYMLSFAYFKFRFFFRS